jgi:hypothetical protein
MADAEPFGQGLQIEAAGLPGRPEAASQGHQFRDGGRGVLGEGGIGAGRRYRFVGHGRLKSWMQESMTTQSPNHHKTVFIGTQMGWAILDSNQ